MSDDSWADLADLFADEAYASVKGYVRTYVLHRQLLEHLPPPPAPVLDVGGGERSTLRRRVVPWRARGAGSAKPS